MDTTIETNRLLLRVIHPNYAGLILSFYENNREYLEKWEPSRPPQFYSEVFQKTNLIYEYNEMVKSNFLRFWLFKKEDPFTPIGTVCFSNFLRGAFQTCMLGYKLDHRNVGRGYATEALTTAIPKVFKDFGLHRMEAYVHPCNESSIRLMERLQFVSEGLSYSCIEINGEWEDHYRYARIMPPQFYRSE